MSNKLVYVVRDRAIGLVDAVNSLPGKTALGLEEGEVVDYILFPVNIERSGNRWYVYMWVSVRDD